MTANTPLNQTGQVLAILNQLRMGFADLPEAQKAQVSADLAAIKVFVEELAGSIDTARVSQPLPPLGLSGSNDEPGGLAGEIDISAGDGTEQALLESQSQVHTIFDDAGRAMVNLISARQAEEPARQIEALLSRAFRASPVPLAIIRASDGQFIDINDSFERLLGYTREELLGRTTAEVGIYSLVGDREGIIQPFREQGSLRNFEIDVPTKTREVRHLLYSLDPFEIGGEACILATIIDITEQKRAEEELRTNTQALRENETRFRGAFNHAAIGFAMTTPEGIFVEANPAYCALTGYSLDELKTFAFNRLVHPDDIAQNLCQNERMLSGQIDGYVIENRYIRKDGQVVWVRKSVSHTRSVDGASKWNIVLVEDISESRRRTEELRVAGAALNERNLALEQAHNELINERNRLLAVMDALPVGLAIYDLKGGVVQANQGFEAVWGSPRPPATSVDDYDLYKAWWVETGERVQAEEWAAARAVKNGETVAGQYIRIQKFDGTLGYILNSGAPIRDAQGQIIGGAVAIMEITDRVLAEQALKISQERFRVALSSVPLLVYTCDRDRRYTWVYNPLRGFHVDDVLGKRDEEVLPPEAAGVLAEAKQQALDSGQGSVKEIKLPVNGQNTYYIFTTEPIKDDWGNVTGLTCAAIDITTQKLLEIEQEENQMRMEVQRQLMEFRERERQEIARDLHDGPLQMLSATIFNLQSVKEATQDPVHKLELEQAALNLKVTVRELRDTMNALRPPAIIHFGFAKSARMHVEDFREKYPDLKISLRLIEDRHLLSEMARLAVFRIFQESLNNIARHAQASRVQVHTSLKQGNFILRIRDDGRGFEVPADLTRLTQQGHFGLAGMRERAEALGGRFEIESAPDSGTQIFVQVPSVPADGQRRSNP